MKSVITKFAALALVIAISAAAIGSAEAIEVGLKGCVSVMGIPVCT